MRITCIEIKKMFLEKRSKLLNNFDIPKIKANFVSSCFEKLSHQRSYYFIENIEKTCF